MLKHLKVVRTIVTNLLLAAFAGFAISEGGNPTLIGSATVIGFTLVNGIEVGDWLAVRRALQEFDHPNDRDQ